MLKQCQKDQKAAHLAGADACRVKIVSALPDAVQTQAILADAVELDEEVRHAAWRGQLTSAGARSEHQAKIIAAYGYRSSTSVEQQLVGWVADTAWTSGGGPTALFDGAVAWLRKRQVLLPGLSRLVQLVVAVLEGTTQRLYDTLAQAVPGKRTGELVWFVRCPRVGGSLSSRERRHRPATSRGQCW